MTTLAFHALAPTFAHTQDATWDFSITVTDVVGAVTGVVATGTYRMCLAPAATDFLRALESAMNTALTASAITVEITISSAGVVRFDFPNGGGMSPPGVVQLDFANPVWYRLGLAASSSFPSGTPGVLLGARPVWHLAILTAATGPYWQPAQAGGIGRTTGGRVYAVAASLTSWSRSLDVSMQPTLPVDRITRACEASAFYPAPEYMDALGSTATAREWSVLDVIYSARNASCGYASGTWQTIRTSTSERFWIAYVGPATLLATASTPIKAAWLAYALWTLELVAPVASPTGTRA